MIQLVSVCDVDESRLGRVARARKYTDYNKMLDNESLDFIIILTPHNTHADIVRDAAERGVHSLKEKPLARSLSEGFKVMKYAKKYNVKIETAVQRRFTGAYRRYFDMAHDIGKTFFINSRYSIFIPNPHEGWRSKKYISGGGAILDMGYHMFDILIWYFGLPTAVYSEYSNQAVPGKQELEDTANISFRYDNSLYGNLFLSISARKEEHTTLLGSGGSLELSRERISRCSLKGDELDTIEIPYSWSDGAMDMIKHFCDVIDSHQPDIYGPENNLNHMAFIEAAYNSGQVHLPVSPKMLLEVD